MRRTAWVNGRSLEVIAVRHKRSDTAYAFTQQGHTRDLQEQRKGNRVQVGKEAPPFSKFKPTRVHFESRYSGYTMVNYSRK